MSPIWAVIAPFVPVIAVLTAALAIGLFVVWLAVGGALWAARAGRADGAALEANPEWFAELPAEAQPEAPAAATSESSRR
jgi:hypothetical protein